MNKLGNKLWDIIDSYEFVCCTVYVCTSVVLTLFKDIIEFVTNHPPSEFIITLTNIINVIFIPLGLVYSANLIQQRKNLRIQVRIYMNTILTSYADGISYTLLYNSIDIHKVITRITSDYNILYADLPSNLQTMDVNKKYIDYFKSVVEKYNTSMKTVQDNKDLIDSLNVPNFVLDDMNYLLKELK